MGSLSELYTLKVKVKHKENSAIEKEILVRKGQTLADALTLPLNIRWNRMHALGWKIESVEGKASNNYHFAIVDERSGRRYMPYVRSWKNAGKRVYLDLRNIRFDPQSMKDKSVEIFFVYECKDMENSVKTRYDKEHATFRLYEFSDIPSYARKGFGKALRNWMGDLEAERYAVLFSQNVLKEPPFGLQDSLKASFQLDGAEKDGNWLAKWKLWGAQKENRGRQHFPSQSEAAYAVGFAQMEFASAPLLNAGRQDYQESKLSCFSEGGKMLLSHGKLEGGEEEKGSGRLNKPVNRLEDASAEGKRSERTKSEREKEGRAEKRRAFKPVPISALSSFKAVIFDLDGVIVNSELVHPKTFEKALEEYGVKIGRRLWKRNYTGIGSYAIFEDLVRKHNIPKSPQELVRIRNEIYMKHIQKEGLELIEGFPKFRDMLCRKKILQAVASGGHENHIRESLKQAGMADVPFVAIEHVKKGKPSPETFLLAAQRLKVKPSECIVFEDSLSGTEAAARAGMPCIALSTTLPKKELAPRAALVVKNFKSRRLLALIKKLLIKRKAEKGKRKRKGK